jgi:hypothetical protein
MFVDDTACLEKHKNLNELMTKFNAEISKLVRWFRTNKMVVNISKTKFTIFHTRGKPIPNKNLTLTYNDNELDNSVPNCIFTIDRYQNNHPSLDKRAYKLLAIYLDEYLFFDYHTKTLCSKLKRSLFCINRAKYFLTPKALLTIYYALIHSHLTYCPIILGCAQNTNIKKITTIQKKAIRTITNKKAGEHTSPLVQKLKILTYEKTILQAESNLCMPSTINMPLLLLITYGP